MAAGHRIPNPPAISRTIDRNLDDAQSSGDLDLSNRKLNEFPKTAESYDLSDTVETNLSKNRFTEIPNEICQFLLLEKLNCYHNAIRSLPESLDRMKYLGFIDLSRNQLSTIPPFLCTLRSLEVLLVSNNRLLSIPEEVGQLSSLMELDVSGNEIAAIPSQIGDMTALRILNLRNNMLAELPPEISKLNLKSLDFSCNRIQAVPLEFRRMESLEELILDNNPLISPPAYICTKGRVHILKYLKILALKEDKRGLLPEPGFNRNTLRRSYQKEDAESMRMRRRAVVSTDSGYITDNPNRWAGGGAIENGLDSTVKAGESLKEQRAERHLELQKRICNAELHSPSRSGSAFSPTTDAGEEVGTDGNISPLKLAAGGTAEFGEDMFARELQRQKQEYEARKRRAEQVKAEGGRRSGKPPTPVTPSTALLTMPTTTPTSRPGSRPLQAPVRSASVNTESRDKDEAQEAGHGISSNGGADTSIERSVTDSHRSSPLSVSSQDGDGRTSGTSSVASSGAQETSSINRPLSAKLASNIAQRRPASANASTTDNSQGSFKAASKSAKALPSQPSQSQQGTSGKTGLRVPKAIKARSKTAPLPRTTSSLAHQQQLQQSSPAVPGGIRSPSSLLSSSLSKHSSSSARLPVKAALNVSSSQSVSMSSTHGKAVLAAAAAAPPPNSKFGFQPVRSVNTRNVSPAATNGRELPPQSYAEPQSRGDSMAARLADDAQNIADIKQVIESRLKMQLPNDVMGELRDGVLLCHLANNIKPRTVSQIHVKSSAVPKLTMAKCKRNVENFLDACRRLGVPQEQMCTQADIIDDKHPGHILRTIYALIDLKPAIKSSNSNQTTGSRSSTPRSRSSLTGSQSRSTNGSRTASSKQGSSHPPLHSFV